MINYGALFLSPQSKSAPDWRAGLNFWVRIWRVGRRGARAAGKAGAHETTTSLSNVSVWATMDDAHPLDRFQPMLDLGKAFIAKGAIFERPIMNYDTRWESLPGSI